MQRMERQGTAVRLQYSICKLPFLFWSIAIKLKSFVSNACRMRVVNFEETPSNGSRDTAMKFLVLQVKCVSLMADRHQNDNVCR